MTHTIKSATRLLALPIVSAAIVACHDAYDALFLDPDRSTTARIEYLFTQGLLDSDFPIHYLDRLLHQGRHGRAGDSSHLRPAAGGPEGEL